MEPVSQFLTVLFLVCLNGFFVTAEFAFVKVQLARFDEYIEKGSRRARVALHIANHLDAYLSACQIGITIASLALGWVGEPFIAHYLRPLLFFAGISSEAVVHATALVIAFSIITFLHIVLGEMAPKSFAIRRPLDAALNCAVPLRFFYIAGYPVIQALNQSANFFVRLVGVDTEESVLHSHSDVELRAMLNHSGKTGALSEGESKMLDRVFEFHEKEAHQIIVPRPDIVYLSTGSDAVENLLVAEKCGFTRFPLCEESIDRVIGFVHVKDLYRAVRSENGPVKMTDLRRDILFFPEHITLDRVLKEFQSKKVHLAIVIDEYGGTLGMLTLEDVIEEVVGEIQDEFDRELPPVRRVGKDEFLLDGSCAVSQFEEMTGVPLPETGADTVAGVMLDTSGDLPAPGERVEIDGGTLIVEDIVDQRIVRVRLLRDPVAPRAAG